VSFVALAILNSLNIIPDSVTEIATPWSRWFLFTAIAAVGMKTSLRDIRKVGGPAVALLVCQTLFSACFVVFLLLFTGL